MICHRVLVAVASVCLISLAACETSPQRPPETQKPPVLSLEPTDLARKLIRLEMSYGAMQELADVGADVLLENGKLYIEELLERPLYYDEQISLRDAYRRALEKVYTTEDYVEAYAPVYAKHLSQEEMVEIIRFYETPAGAKMLSSESLFDSELSRETERLLNEKWDEFKRVFADEFTKEFFE